MKKLVVLLGIFVVFTAFYSTTNPLFYIPKGWQKPVYDFGNRPVDSNIIRLGKMLFYDPILSKDSSTSCSSCHSNYSAFAHNDHDLSHGIYNRIGKRNAPALFNLAWQNKLMWDGAIHSLKLQALAPLTNPDEMAENIDSVLLKLQRSHRYNSLFKKAFGSNKSINTDNFLTAISSFLAIIISADSKYDKVMRKEKGVAFNAYEKQGYELFKTHCNSCHTEPLFTNNSFESNGLAIDSFLKDYGRYNITHLPSDSMKFKVPSLRNVEATYPYMHDGRFKNLQMVLFHYTETIQTSPTLSPLLRKKIQLTEADKNCLIAFLKTLTDESFLNNKTYEPESF